MLWYTFIVPVKLTIAYDEENKTSLYKRKPIIFGVLILAVILTVLFLQGKQDIRQRAAPTIGDINGDSNVDLLDYNIFISCYGQKVARNLCTHKGQVDFNKDGNVGGVDYNLLLRGMFSQQELPVGKVTPTPVNSIGDRLLDAIQSLQKELNLLNLGSTEETNDIDQDIENLDQK